MIHGSKTYLAVTSLLGLVAFGAGMQMLFATSELGLAVLVGTMGVLWLIATAHHLALSETAATVRPVRASRHEPRRPASRDGRAVIVSSSAPRSCVRWLI